MPDLILHDVTHLTVSVDVQIRSDTVALHYRDRLSGIIDRDTLKTWLTNPYDSLAYDDVTWSRTSIGVWLIITAAIEPEPTPFIEGRAVHPGTAAMMQSPAPPIATLIDDHVPEEALTALRDAL